MKPTLVVLAAGAGSRYGGLKQMEPVGPGGATILDYSAFDARRAGFERVVFIIRPDMQADFRAVIGDRIARHVGVDYAFQRLEDLPAGAAPPPGRTKPWGTGHATLCAADVVRGPFAIVNADDFYGAEALRLIGEFLGGPSMAAPDGATVHAMVAYRLSDTLSDSGSVSRGVCRCSHDGWLESISEKTRIERCPEGGRSRGESGEAEILPAETPVSMNLWGFRPDFFEQLRIGFTQFLSANATSPSAEFYLPAAVQELIHARRARVRVLRTTDKWIGITHRDDLPKVREHIALLVRRGVYPAQLWD